jgi:hypothetical protein
MVHRLQLPPVQSSGGAEASTGGLEVIVRVANARALDVDLEVFASEDAVSTGLPLCETGDIGPVKVCRVPIGALTERVVFARVTPLAGQPDTSYSIEHRLLAPPALGATGLFGDDAAADGLSAESIVRGVIRRAPENVGSALQRSRIHKLTGARDGQVITLTSPAGTALLEASLYDASGSLVSASERPRAQQRLLIPEAQESGYVVVSAVGEMSSPVSYELGLRALQAEDLIGGYVYKRGLTNPDYDALVEFANTDAGTQSSRVRSVYEFVKRSFAGVLKEDEPVVAFVGISDVNRIRLLARDGEDFALSTQSGLGRARHVWAVYIEDDPAPFNTSIVVGYRGTAAELNDEFFDVPIARDSAAGPSGRRTVRFGMKKFRVKPPPSAMLVSFVRRSPTYGSLTASALYRSVGWSRIDWGLGAFFAATQIQRARIETPEAVPSDGSLPSQDVIVQNFDSRQVFAVATLKLTRFKEQAIDGRAWAKAVPYLTGGIGLPTRGNSAYLLALSWPIIGDAIQGTAGMVGIRQQTLVPGYQVGQRLPRFSDDSGFIYGRWRWQGTFGVTVDLRAVGKAVR